MTDTTAHLKCKYCNKDMDYEAWHIQGYACIRCKNIVKEATLVEKERLKVISIPLVELLERLERNGWFNVDDEKTLWKKALKEFKEAINNEVKT